MVRLPVLLLLVCGIASCLAFTNPRFSSPRMPTTRKQMADAAATYLHNPAERDAHYGNNLAQYLLDLHNSKSTFNFCGGMMFQLVLSQKLKEHLEKVSSDEEQPVVYDSTKSRMFQIPEYSQSAFADNVHLFHGREIRKVPNAAGGMGFVLQLSLANANDPEGWTAAEVEGYDGWGHDVGRTWRKGDRLVEEGFTTFKEKFGPDAFALHHRFYLHYDGSKKMWLSAEDGCEGTPAEAGVFSKLQSMLFG